MQNLWFTRHPNHIPDTSQIYSNPAIHTVPSFKFDLPLIIKIISIYSTFLLSKLSFGEGYGEIQIVQKEIVFVKRIYKTWKRQEETHFYGKKGVEFLLYVFQKSIYLCLSVFLSVCLFTCFHACVHVFLCPSCLSAVCVCLFTAFVSHGVVEF